MKVGTRHLFSYLWFSYFSSRMWPENYLMTAELYNNHIHKLSRILVVKKQLTSTKSFGTVIRADFCIQIVLGNASIDIDTSFHYLILAVWSKFLFFVQKYETSFHLKSVTHALITCQKKAIFWLEKVKTSVLAKVWCIWIIRSLLI